MKIARTTQHIRTEPLGCIVSYVQLLLSLINFRSRGHVFLPLSLFQCVSSRMIITFGFFLTRHLGPFATFHESIGYSLDCGGEGMGTQVRIENVRWWWSLMIVDVKKAKRTHNKWSVHIMSYITTSVHSLLPHHIIGRIPLIMSLLIPHKMHLILISLPFLHPRLVQQLLIPTIHHFIHLITQFGTIFRCSLDLWQFEFGKSRGFSSGG